MVRFLLNYSFFLSAISKNILKWKLIYSILFFPISFTAMARNLAADFKKHITYGNSGKWEFWTGSKEARWNSFADYVPVSGNQRMLRTFSFDSDTNPEIPSTLKVYSGNVENLIKILDWENFEGFKF